MSKNKKNGKKSTRILKGVYNGSSRGYGFVHTDDDDDEMIFVMRRDVNTAINGDVVEVELIKNAVGDKVAEGRIVNVIERNSNTIVGKFERAGSFGFVVPADSRIATHIFVPKSGIAGAAHDDMVVVKIDKWPSDNKYGGKPEGHIIEILGCKGDPGVDVMAVIRSHGIRTDFPAKVVAEADKIPSKLDDECIKAELKKGRVDLRDKCIITIDGATAKDLDDAVCVEKLPNGVYKLGVHIADVSHYVVKDSPIDKEALLRGTSVYFVDRVVPMLPKNLSNGICSLNPRVDRLTMSCEMIVNADGKIVEHEIFESIIRTTERMTYDDVYEIIENNNSELCEKYQHIYDMLMDMKALSNILREKRERRGAIEFEFDESQIVVNEAGRPIDVVRVIRNSAHEMIEDFMLAANETVAEHYYWYDAPFVYRVHEVPSLEKLNTFSRFATNLGFQLENVNNPTPLDFQKLLKKAEGSKESQALSVAMLRAMQKAKYSAAYGIHFGLAAEYYTHFTSPIRRYPDLIVHRLIKQYAKHGKPKNMQKLYSEIFEIANKNSESEVVAEMAERDVLGIKKFELMREHIGEEFHGVISGVTSFGVFVELENTCEGLVPITLLTDDYYDYYEDKYALIGERTKRELKLGDKVDIVIVAADEANHKLEFILSEFYDEFRVTATIKEVLKQNKKRTKSGGKKHKGGSISKHPAKAKNILKSKGKSKGKKSKKKGKKK